LDTVVASTEVKTSLEILKLKFFTWSRNCLAVLVRFRCLGFGAILVTCGMVRLPPFEVEVEDALAFKFTNFKSAWK
jgi:hypothetical protein